MRAWLRNIKSGTISVVIAANWDGSNNPIIYAGTQALSGNIASALHFGCGPVQVNGSPVPGIKNITISSGVQLIQEGSGSDEWPTFTGLEFTQPSITVQTIEVVNWGTFLLDGTALNGSTGLRIDF